MSMDPLQIAQRLEELSVELECEELQGLANELAEFTPPPPVDESRRAKEMAFDIVRMLERQGLIDLDEIYVRSRERRNDLLDAHRLALYMSPTVDPSTAMLIKGINPA